MTQGGARRFPDLLADQLSGRKGISHADLHVNKSLVDSACAKRKEEQAKASITAHLSFVIHITLRTARTSQQCKPSDNARSDLIIFRLGMTVAPEFRRLPQQAAPKPRTMPLPLMCNDLDF